jgi:hypothetical protein
VRDASIDEPKVMIADFFLFIVPLPFCQMEIGFNSSPQRRKKTRDEMRRWGDEEETFAPRSVEKRGEKIV